MSIEQQPINSPLETSTEMLGNLDQLEAEALRAQQAASQTLQEIAAHKDRQNSWTQVDSNESQTDFDSIQAHLGNAEGRDLYADTMPEPASLDPAQLLKAKHDAITQDDETALKDIRNHNNGTDKLAEALSEGQLSRRELAELRRTAIENDDQDSVLTIQNALAAKLGITKSSPVDQQQAFDKLDRLAEYQAPANVKARADAKAAKTALADKAVQAPTTEAAPDKVVVEVEPVKPIVIETKKPDGEVDDAVVSDPNPDPETPVVETDAQAVEPIVEPTIASPTGERSDELAATADQIVTAVVPKEEVAAEEPPKTRATLTLVPELAGQSDTVAQPADADAIEPSLEESDEQPEQLKNHRLSVGSAEQANRGEDRIIKDATHSHYGVIDGMGGHEAGGIAAEVIQNVLTNYWESANTADIDTENAVEFMKEAFILAQRSLVDNAENGHGSADMGAAVTDIKLFEDAEGRLRAVVGHAGDTRLYLQSGQNEPIGMLTEDEGEGKYIDNGIFASQATRLDQFFVTPPLEMGSRLMLCSDGITGDTKEQFLTEAEMANAFAAISEQDAADHLLAISRKQDDKSVLVIDVEPSSSNQVKPAADGEMIEPKASTEVVSGVVVDAKSEDLQTVADRLNGETKLKGGFFRQSLRRIRNELQPGGRVVVSEDLDDDGNRLPDGQSLLAARDLSFYEARADAKDAKDAEDDEESKGIDNDSRTGRARRLGGFVSKVATVGDEHVRSILAERLAKRTEYEDRVTRRTVRRLGRRIVSRVADQRPTENLQV